MVRRAELDVVITGDSESLRRSTRRANEALDSVRDRANETGRAISRSMGRRSPGSMALQNASFQFADFATQVGAGTSASIALGQQLPQLLGGFGVLGAVIGAVVAIGVPLVRVMRGANVEAGTMARLFGELSPVVDTLAGAFAGLREFASTAIGAVINNLDRIIITAGVAVALFAGRWVAGIAIARIATMSLVGSLVALRAALIRTGVGILIIGIGELVYQFTRLTNAAGGLGEVFGLIGAVFSELWERLRMGVNLMAEAFGGLGMIIQGALMEAFGVVETAWVNLNRSITGGINAIARGLNNTFGTSFGQIAPMESTGIGADGTAIRTMGQDVLSSAQGGLGTALAGPLGSVQAIRDVLASIRDDNLTLPELLGVGGGEDGEGGSGSGEDSQTALERALEQQANAIQSFHDNIAMIQSNSLAGQLAGWGSYFRSLGNLMGSEGERMGRIAAAFDAIQAVRNAWVAYTEALATPGLGVFSRFLYAAQVFAAGMGAVSAIKNIGGSGGGGGSPAGAPSVPSGQDEQSGGGVSRNVAIQLVGGDMFSRDSVISLINGINEAVEDGAIVRFVS